MLTESDFVWAFHQQADHPTVVRLVLEHGEEITKRVQETTSAQRKYCCKAGGYSFLCELRSDSRVLIFGMPDDCLQAVNDLRPYEKLD
jgi:hypothetical protein